MTYPVVGEIGFDVWLIYGGSGGQTPPTPLLVLNIYINHHRCTLNLEPWSYLLFKLVGSGWSRQIWWAPPPFYAINQPLKTYIQYWLDLYTTRIIAQLVSHLVGSREFQGSNPS